MFDAGLESFFQFLVRFSLDGYQLEASPPGTAWEKGGECDGLLTAQRTHIQTRRHGHDDGAPQPFTFLPQEDRVVLPIAHEKS